MAYCLFMVAIPLTNLVSFLLRYLAMHDTRELPATCEWESGYNKQYTFSPGNVNQPDYSTSDSERDSEENGEEEAHPMHEDT